MRIRINAATFSINGKRVRVKIVRESKLCKWLTNKDFLVLGHTIYYAASRLRGSQIQAGLNEVRRLHEVGYVKFYWDLLTTR